MFTTVLTFKSWFGTYFIFQIIKVKACILIASFLDFIISKFLAVLGHKAKETDLHKLFSLYCLDFIKLFHLYNVFSKIK